MAYKIYSEFKKKLDALVKDGLASTNNNGGSLLVEKYSLEFSRVLASKIKDFNKHYWIMGLMQEYAEFVMACEKHKRGQGSKTNMILEYGDVLHYLFMGIQEEGLFSVRDTLHVKEEYDRAQFGKIWQIISIFPKYYKRCELRDTIPFLQTDLMVWRLILPRIAEKLWAHLENMRQGLNLGTVEQIMAQNYKKIKDRFGKGLVGGIAIEFC